MESEIVQLHKVSKSYYRDRLEIPVLRQLSLSIPSGGFVALLGPSGSGKSTLLNLMAGLDRPNQGSVQVNQTQVHALSDTKLSRWRARHIGIVFQFYNLIPVLTAAENIELPLLLTHLSQRARMKHVQTALSLVGLSDRAHHYPRQLSGGQEQRVAIARAIVTDPDILLADEPTGNLDSEAAEDIMSVLQRLNQEKGKTIILVTHDEQAAQKTQYIHRLNKGVLVEDP